MLIGLSEARTAEGGGEGSMVMDFVAPVEEDREIVIGRWLNMSCNWSRVRDER